MSTLQRCISNPTASSPANNSSTSGLDDDDLYEADDLAELRERSTLWNTEERKMGTRKWRCQGILQGSVENGVIRIYVCPLSSFSLPTPLEYTMQLYPTHQHHLSLLSPPYGVFWRGCLLSRNLWGCSFVVVFRHVLTFLWYAMMKLKIVYLLNGCLFSFSLYTQSAIVTRDTLSEGLRCVMS